MPGYVDYGVVETERDVAAVSSQGNHDVVRARYAFPGFPAHVFFRVAFLIERHDVDELSGGRTVFIHFRDIPAVSHAFLLHVDFHLLHHRILRVDDV